MNTVKGAKVLFNDYQTSTKPFSLKRLKQTLFQYFLLFPLALMTGFIFFKHAPGKVLDLLLRDILPLFHQNFQPARQWCYGTSLA